MSGAQGKAGGTGVAGVKVDDIRSPAQALRTVRANAPHTIGTHGRLMALFGKTRSRRLDTRAVMPHKELPRDVRDIIAVKREGDSLLRATAPDSSYVVPLNRRDSGLGITSTTWRAGLSTTNRTGLSLGTTAATGGRRRGFIMASASKNLSSTTASMWK